MAILGTSKVTAASGSSAASEGKEVKAKKKPLTQAEKVELLSQAFFARLSDGMDKGEVFGVFTEEVGKLFKGKKATSARGIFFQIFGTVPVEGTKVTPSEVLDRTDGKGALTESVLKKWGEPGKGVPYGKGATALVSFHKRIVAPDGSVTEAYYCLDRYLEANTAMAEAGVEPADENGFNA